MRSMTLFNKKISKAETPCLKKGFVSLWQKAGTRGPRCTSCHSNAKLSFSAFTSRCRSSPVEFLGMLTLQTCLMWNYCKNIPFMFNLHIQQWLTTTLNTLRSLNHDYYTAIMSRVYISCILLIKVRPIITLCQIGAPVWSVPHLEHAHRHLRMRLHRTFQPTIWQHLSSLSHSVDSCWRLGWILSQGHFTSSLWDVCFELPCVCKDLLDLKSLKGIQ